MIETRSHRAGEQDSEATIVKLRVRALQEQVAGSLWFAPTAIIAVAIGASFGLIEIDRAAGDVGNRLVFSGSATSARAVLATVAASMLTIIGVTVPLTIVALQLASGQFTQRILRNFLHDRVVQGFLGTFIGVFAYALLVLRVVRSADEANETFVPQVSVTLCIVLSLLSLALFAAYVNHIVNLIQVTHIMQSVASETRRAIGRLFPGEVGEGAPDTEAPEPPEDAPAVLAASSGYLQAVDTDALYRLACERYETVWVVRRIGEFCSEDAVLMRLARDGPDGQRRMERLVQIGRYRTVRDDALFGFRQIADIAVRALSPGVNDPTTATQCVDYLGSLLLMLCQRELPASVRKDARGVVRLVVRRPDFEAYLSEAFDQIREFSGGNVAVTRRLIQVLAELARETLMEERRSLVLRELTLVLNGARRGVREPADLGALEKLAQDSTAGL